VVAKTQKKKRRGKGSILRYHLRRSERLREEKGKQGK
jgi:hypothetical protein